MSANPALRNFTPEQKPLPKGCPCLSVFLFLRCIICIDVHIGHLFMAGSHKDHALPQAKPSLSRERLRGLSLPKACHVFENVRRPTFSRALDSMKKVGCTVLHAMGWLVIRASVSEKCACRAGSGAKLRGLRGKSSRQQRGKLLLRFYSNCCLPPCLPRFARCQTRAPIECKQHRPQATCAISASRAVHSSRKSSPPEILASAKAA